MNLENKIGDISDIKKNVSDEQINGIKTPEQSLESDIPKITDYKSFETEMGSVYKVLPNGTVQRFKTVENELNEPQDLIVFMKFKDDEQRQDFLRGVQRSKEFGTKVYVIDKNGRKIDSNIDVENNEIALALVNIKTNTVIDFVRAINIPEIGYNVFDQRRFAKDGESYREKHIGNKVISIIKD